MVNLFFYLGTKNNIFGYYLFFLISINLSVLSVDGFLLTILQKEDLFILILIFKYFVPITGALFASNFLILDFKKPFIISCIFSAIILVLYLYSYHTQQFIFEAFADTFAFLHLIVYWVYGLNQYKKSTYAKFFVIGYSIILVFGICYVLPDNYNLQNFIVPIAYVKIGAMFEMIILSSAISYRMKVLKEKIEITQQQLTNYLTKLQDLEKNNQVIVHKLVKEFNLTDKESEIVLKLLEKKTYKAIAEELQKSPNTIKYHVKNIYQKLDISKKEELKNVVTVSTP